MNVGLIGNSVELRAMVRPLLREGVNLSKRECELTLHDNLSYDTGKRFFVGAEHVPPQITSSLGFELRGGQTTHMATKIYTERGWIEQTKLYVPVFGLMNGGLGASVVSAVTGKTIQTERFSEHFSSQPLLDLLRTMKYVGPITFCFSGEGLVGLWYGIPYLGLFNLLECVRGKISEWFLEPTPLMDSWTVGLYLSRFPYPLKENMTEYKLDGVTEEVERHLWLPDVTSQRKVLYSSRTLTGIITAWGRRLLDVELRTLWTAGNICLTEKQYRSDLTRSTKGQWERLGLLV